MGSFRISGPEGASILETPKFQLNVSPNGSGRVGSPFVIMPPFKSGRYSIQIRVNDELMMDESFALRVVTADDLPKYFGTAPAATA